MSLPERDPPEVWFAAVTNDIDQAGPPGSCSEWRPRADRRQERSKCEKQMVTSPGALSSRFRRLVVVSTQPCLFRLTQLPPHIASILGLFPKPKLLKNEQYWPLSRVAAGRCGDKDKCLQQKKDVGGFSDVLSEHCKQYSFARS